MTVSPARRAAYEVLRRVFEDDAYADRALRTASAGLGERDRALARQLAFGAVQRVRTLDHAIETLGKRPVRKLDAPVLAALRLGAYQLGYLDGVPRYAAVNESVELVRRARLERAVPFTNAVLRRVAEGIDALLTALPEGALKHSYPDWVWEIWLRDLGEAETVALARGPSSVSTRNPCKKAKYGRKAAPRSWSATSSAPNQASACSTSARRRVARRRCSPARWSRSR